MRASVQGLSSEPPFLPSCHTDRNLCDNPLMSADYFLFTPDPVALDTWAQVSAQFGLTVHTGDYLTVTEESGVLCCTIAGPFDTQDDSYKNIVETNDEDLMGWSGYAISCPAGSDADLALLLLHRVAEPNGDVYDPQIDEWYPDRNRTARERAESSALKWVKNLSRTFQYARRAAAWLVALGIVTFLIVGVLVAVAERRAGGRFGPDTNGFAVKVVVGLLVFIVASYLAYEMFADLRSAQLRRASHEWLASLTEPPPMLPWVFAKAYEESHVKNVLAFVALVIASGFILGGLAFVFADLPEAPQPQWFWGGCAVLIGVLFGLLALWLRRHARAHPFPNL